MSSARPGPVARVRAAAARGDLRYLARIALGRAGWCELVVLARELAAEPQSVEPPPVPVEVRPLEPRDLDAYARLRPDPGRADAERRLAARHLCMAVLVDGRVAAASWTRFDRVWLPILERSLPLDEGDAYTYDSFTDPELRRLRLATFRAQRTFAELRSRGCRRLVACVLVGNEPGLAAARAAGLEPVRRIRWRHVGPLGLESHADAAGRTTSRRLVRARREPEL